MSTPAASPATSPPAYGGAPAVSRLERLEIMLQCLEEIRSSGGCGGNFRLGSEGSSPASGGGGRNSPESSLERKKGLRNMEEMVMETRVKGSLVDRIKFLESRFLQLEEIMESEKKREMEEFSPNKSSEKKKHKSLRNIVKSCVKGNLSTKD